MSEALELFTTSSFQETGPPLPDAPLADRIRPTTLEDFVGQTHLLGDGKALQKMIARDQLRSMILWGPPGSGKTTLAKIIAAQTASYFVFFSATSSGVPEFKKILKEAQLQWRRARKRTILFVDEIHRLNKLQQDAFLPHVENGTIILIGATTENPSFEVNRALLSRCQVYILYQLSLDDIVQILRRSLEDEKRGLGMYQVTVEDDVCYELARQADGDTRIALNLLELVVLHVAPDPEKSMLGSTLEQVVLRATCPVASVNRPDKIKDM